MKRKYVCSAVSGLAISVGIIAASLTPSNLAAQGEDNPTGVAGVYNGNVTSGGSYDPLTGNALRVVDDIVVPGCVGAYPLRWTRYNNSRHENHAGFDGWSFSYDYVVYNSKITLPDGRDIPNGSSVLGIIERKIQTPDYNYALLLADGGRVIFEWYHYTWHTRDYNGNVILMSGSIYRPTKLVDPYGQTTLIQYGPSTNEFGDVLERRTKIIEPGGRYLQINYASDTTGADMIGVQAFDGVPGHSAIQTVTYAWAYSQIGNVTLKKLTDVGYSDGTYATYTYEIMGGPSTHRPVLLTADDTHYNGPMRQIAYVHGGIGKGAIDLEKKPTGQVVSTLLYTADPPSETKVRTERRGDGNTRIFSYGGKPPKATEGVMGKLINYTDYAGHTTWLHYGERLYPGCGFIISVTDARGAYDGDPNHTTTYTRGNEAVPGQRYWAIYRITHPDGSHIDQTFTDDANPYYLHDRTDERGNTTTYHRDDPNNANAITEIDYPSDSQTPASFETFEYNAKGQVTKHRLKNGAYQHFQYDSRWLLVAKWNPTSNSTPIASDPQTTYTYYTASDVGAWTDRVKTETDPRGNTTTYEYDYGFDTNGNNTSAPAGRGLVTKITHADNTYQLFVYNKYGDKMWEENENHERTSYAYDDYGRVLTVKNPLNKIIATNDYTAPSGASFYTHTTSSVNTTTTATGVVIKNNYDVNWRKTSATVGFGTANPATTTFAYDNVGNLTIVTDPNQHPTTTDYDARNRKWHVCDALGHQTIFGYDPASNVITITRPDLSVEIKTYDALNRLLTDTIPKEGTPPQLPTETITTQFAYNPSGSLYSVTDGKNQTTTFEYDPSDLKTKMTYPNGTDYQSWTYDPAKNLIARRTVNGVSQLFSYDSRNRQFAMAWSDGADWANFAYDDASRMISAENPTSTITRAYDAAGRLTLDRQRLRILPLTAVSRKIHGSAGTFNIALPLVGTPGIECRTGGANNAHQIVVTFPRTVTLSGASVTSGTGSVSGSPIVTDGTTVTINLTGVTNAQTITVTLAGVNDGITTNNVNINMGVLWGDTTGNGFVNSADVSQTQAQSGWPVTSSNFREDVTANGFINSGDVGVVQWQSGHSLPSAPPLTQPVPSSPDIDVRYDYFDDGTEKQLFVTQNGAPTGYDLTYGYDEQRRFKTISNTNGATLFTYTYDAASNEVDRLNNTTGVDQSYGTPDPLNRMTQRDVKSNTGAMLSHEAYGYDPQRPGLLTTVTRQEQSQTQTQDFFAYDLTGEVTNAQYAVPSGGSAVRTCGYVWDKAGNRASVTDNGLFISYNTTGNVLNQYWNVGTDAVGNGTEHELASYQNVFYTYINDTHLSSVSGMDVNGGRSTYQLSYDALGRCVARVLTGSTSSTTYYIYDGEKPILEYHSWSGPSAANIYGRGIDEILQRTDYTANPARTLYYQDDHEGSVTHLTDGTGAVLESYRYDAFGKPTINGGALTASAFGNRFMFTGREYVSQFGVYEYRNRAYHPGLGRFMSEDPKGFGAGDNNFFRYCANDPVDHTDAMGLSQDSVLLTANQQNLEHGQGAHQGGASQLIAAAQVKIQVSVDAHSVEMHTEARRGALDAAIKGIQGHEYNSPLEALKAGVTAGYKQIQLDRMNGVEQRNLTEYHGTAEANDNGTFSITGPDKGGHAAYVPPSGNRPGTTGYFSSFNVGQNTVGYYYAHIRPADLIANHSEDIESAEAVHDRRGVLAVSAAPRRGDANGWSAPIFQGYNGSTHEFIKPGVIERLPDFY